MSSTEIQFSASEGRNLADALRRALGEEGRPPSKARVRAWIAEGRVRVEGVVTKDPARTVAAGERVDLRPSAEGVGAEGVGRPTPRGPEPPEGILHLDRHVLLIDYHPPVAVGPGDRDVRAALDRALAGAAIPDPAPRPVPPAEDRVGGLVAAALSETASEALAEAFAAGTAALEVVALVEAPAGSRPEDLRVEAEAGPRLRVRLQGMGSVAEALDDLARRGLRVLAAPGPPRTSPLLVHVAGLRLPHPRTGRALSWTLPPPPDLGFDPR